MQFIVQVSAGLTVIISLGKDSRGKINITYFATNAICLYCVGETHCADMCLLPIRVELEGTLSLRAISSHSFCQTKLIH